MRPVLAPLIIALVISGPRPLAADSPPGGGFSLPVDCRPGSTCWIMNYPDMDGGAEAADPFCGVRTYDAHKGTDFAVRDLADMRRGVRVLAAADGTVRAVRDAMPDRLMRTGADRAALKGRDCGNGLVIDHGGGWETRYCHLKRGSIGPKPGAAVRRGDPLGLVGLSGRTRFPHLHLTVRHLGKALDPATGRALSDGCGGAVQTLWRTPGRAAYEPVLIYAAGFATGAVTAEAIKNDASSPERLHADVPALVLWAAIFGVRKGDRLTLLVVAPDESTVIRRVVGLTKDQAWRLEFAGRKRMPQGWPAGRWRGHAVLHREADRSERSRSVPLIIEAPGNR